MLPQLNMPRIIDAGCGKGGLSLERARLSEGEAIGLDIYKPYLDDFKNKPKEAGLLHRVML
jgi:cyclopropane fatty-acyl-phospholipid synthase-like methyltransferase